MLKVCANLLFGVALGLSSALVISASSTLIAGSRDPGQTTCEGRGGSDPPTCSGGRNPCQNAGNSCSRIAGTNDCSC
jgi:hypothetical protein